MVPLSSVVSDRSARLTHLGFLSIPFCKIQDDQYNPNDQDQTGSLFRISTPPPSPIYYAWTAPCYARHV
ncbi:hypothetical protein AC579_3963 [Pseudocercospora musae]|uniref:Uncharacterized protein n=1 Tax=Pseudocercospora musae TaxID=113226 RepID=A0A139I1S3_9PEZI|nr:hypothetical protein AC579_3963 [Pseudocercospora musae]KXT08669.1 hypothetical protein AC579_3963 [Pseudocercospora musae]